MRRESRGLPLSLRMQRRMKPAAGTRELCGLFVSPLQGAQLQPGDLSRGAHRQFDPDCVYPYNNQIVI